MPYTELPESVSMHSPQISILTVLCVGAVRGCYTPDWCRAAGRAGGRLGYVPEAFASVGSGVVVLAGDLVGDCYRQSEPWRGCSSVGFGGSSAGVVAVGWRDGGIDHWVDGLAA